MFQDIVLVVRQSANGRSQARVDRLLSLEACRCHRKICFSQFADEETQMMKFLETFWSMEKPAQDSFDRPLVVLIVFPIHVAHLCNTLCCSSLVIATQKVGVPCLVPAKICGTINNAPKGNRSWRFLDKIVSTKCLTAIWGIRQGRIVRAENGMVDRRYRCFGAVPLIDNWCPFLFRDWVITL